MKKKPLASKLVCFFVILSMLFNVAPMSVLAVDQGSSAGFSLSIDKDNVKPGEEFAVYVDITENSGLAALDYTLNYNVDAVEVVKAAISDAAMDWSLEGMAVGSMPQILVNTDIAGEVNISADSTFLMQPGGHLVEITFKAKADAVLDDAGFVQTVRTAETLIEKPDGSGERETVDIDTEPALNVEDETYVDAVIVDPDVASIRAIPDKTEYIINDEFDPSGVLAVTYTNDATQEFDLTKATLSEPDMSSAGEKVVTVSYKDKTTEFKIKVSDRTLEKAQFVAPTADQTLYIEGSPKGLDLTGAKWKLTYSDGTTEETGVTEEMCSGYDLNKAGNYKVVVTYPGTDFTGSFDITVQPKKLQTVTLIGEPEQTTYVVNEEKALNTKGLSLSLVYNNGAEPEVIDVTPDMCSGYALDKVGEQVVEVSYNGQKAGEFKINVINEIKSFTVTPPTKVDYVEGQTLDVTGGSLEVTYADKTTDVISMDDDLVVLVYNTDDNGCLIAGKWDVTVSIENSNAKEQKFTINVVPKAITNAVFTPPTADQVYKEGLADQHLNLEGALWTATYNDGTEQSFKVTEEMCDSYDFNKVGEQTVVVKLSGWDKTASFTIVVEPKVAAKAAMETYPVKTNYVAGVDKALDLTNAAIKVDYDNGTSEVIPVTQDMCQGFDSEKTGEQTITVSYTKEATVKTTFKIVLKRTAVSSEWVKNPAPAIFNQGDEFVVNEGSFKVIYSDGSEETLSLTKEMCTDYDLNKAGIQDVTVVYKVPGDAATYEGTLTLTEGYQIAVTGITLAEGPTKTTYKKGEAFDGTGIVATFFDAATGESTEVNWASGKLSVEGFDTNADSVQALTLVYKAEDGTEYKLADAFEVTVGKPDTQPGDASNANNQQGNASGSNPITGVAGTSATIIIALLVVCAVVVKTYRIRSKKR